MGLEAATHINQLVATNPIGASDPKSQGDDHLRLIKSVLVTDFPNINAPVTATPAQLNYTVGVTSAIQVQLDSKAGLALSNVFTVPQTIQVAGTNADLNLRATSAPDDDEWWVIRVASANGRLELFTRNNAAAAVENALTISRSAGGEVNAIAWTGDSFTWNGVSIQNASILTAGTLADARVAQSNVTQHEAAIGTEANTASRVVRRSGVGNIAFSYAVQESGNNENAGAAQIMATIGSDNVVRKCSAQFTDRALTLANWTIQADPGGTPGGTAGQVFAYY